MNQATDIELRRLQCAANKFLGDARGPGPSLAELADDIDTTPTDVEIVDVMVENFGLTHAEAITRLAQFDFDSMSDQFPPNARG